MKLELVGNHQNIHESNFPTFSLITSRLIHVFNLNIWHCLPSQRGFDIYIFACLFALAHQLLCPAQTSPAVNSCDGTFAPPPGHLWKDWIPLGARFMCKCSAALRPTGWPICLMTCQSRQRGLTVDHWYGLLLRCSPLPDAFGSRSASLPEDFLPPLFLSSRRADS